MTEIWENKNYRDETGRTVIARVLVVKEEKKRKKLFYGIGEERQVVRFNNGGEEEQVREFEFPIQAENIHEAFEKYRECGVAFVEKQEELQRKAESNLLLPEVPKIIH